MATRQEHNQAAFLPYIGIKPASNHSEIGTQSTKLCQLTLFQQKPTSCILYTLDIHAKPISMKLPLSLLSNEPDPPHPPPQHLGSTKIGEISFFEHAIYSTADHF